MPNRSHLNPKKGLRSRDPIIIRGRVCTEPDDPLEQLVRWKHLYSAPKDVSTIEEENGVEAVGQCKLRFEPKLGAVLQEHRLLEERRRHDASPAWGQDDAVRAGEERKALEQRFVHVQVYRHVAAQAHPAGDLSLCREQWREVDVVPILPSTSAASPEALPANDLP